MRTSNRHTLGSREAGGPACAPASPTAGPRAATSAAPASPNSSTPQQPREAGACVLATADRTAGISGLRQPPTTRNPGGPAMLTLTGNGRLTRDVQLRTTHSGKTVATISVASDRRDRNADPVYVDLIVWEAQATAAARAPRQGPGRQLLRTPRAAPLRHQRRRPARRARAPRRRHRVRAQAPPRRPRRPDRAEPASGAPEEDIPF